MKRGTRKVTAESDFSEWIFQASELVAFAERLVALEVELARQYGVTWDEIADTLGISRQAAWERFAKPAKRRKTRRQSQAERARKAAWIRDLRNTMGDRVDELIGFWQWREKQQQSETSDLS
ncbi:hypothetical protein ACFQ1S_06895 [Kibdelosporangium lantanae]|uniref:Uncharacterized protein n=1 Tax=Kibdelosporangium lantanae TaxID=1497396 RepID=A0ABW3M3R2_9PSEU